MQRVLKFQAFVASAYFVLGSLAAFTAFFCRPYAIGSIPDWNPVPVHIGLDVCTVAGIAILLTRDACREAEATTP